MAKFFYRARLRMRHNITNQQFSRSWPHCRPRFTAYMMKMTSPIYKHSTFVLKAIYCSLKNINIVFCNLKAVLLKTDFDAFIISKIVLTRKSSSNTKKLSQSWVLFGHVKVLFTSLLRISILCRTDVEKPLAGVLFRTLWF